MCGIAGFTQLHEQSADVAELIWRMTSRLTPRGPDGEGFYVAPGIALGHRRLSDLASLPRNFEVKLDNAFAKVFARAQAARRGMGRRGVSLAVIDNVMARLSLPLITCAPPARSTMPVMKKNPSCANLSKGNETDRSIC
jgi:glutamate synthase domain-containing protein 1